MNICSVDMGGNFGFVDLFIGQKNAVLIELKLFAILTERVLVISKMSRRGEEEERGA